MPSPPAPHPSVTAQLLPACVGCDTEAGQEPICPSESSPVPASPLLNMGRQEPFSELRPGLSPEAAPGELSIWRRILPLLAERSEHLCFPGWRLPHPGLHR